MVSLRRFVSLTGREYSLFPLAVVATEMLTRLMNRLVYFFIYTVRVKGWSFGFGFVTSVVGAVVSTVKESVEGLFGKKEEKEEKK